MKRSAKFGGMMGQFTMLGGLITYFLKGRSVRLRFVYGFLYVYWINHFYTLGSYLTGMLKMPCKQPLTQPSAAPQTNTTKPIHKTCPTGCRSSDSYWTSPGKHQTL